MNSQTPLTDEVRRIIQPVIDIGWGTFIIGPLLRRAIEHEQAQTCQKRQDQQNVTDAGVPREDGCDVKSCRVYCFTCEAFVQPYAPQVYQEESDHSTAERDPGSFQHPDGVGRWYRHIPAECDRERKGRCRQSRESVSKLIHRFQALLHLIRGYLKSGFIHIVGS